MILRLIREPSRDAATLGSLYLDGVWQCWTLEDVVRDVKIQHETAIPAGRYAVRHSFSQRFQRMLPEVLDVPGFTGIRMHPGNTEADTSGCILVGRQRARGMLLDSRLAFADLDARLLDGAAHRIDIEPAYLGG